MHCFPQFSGVNKMSIATNLARIEAARNKIRNKLVSLGLAESTAKLDACATAIDGIVDNGAVSVQVKEGETYSIPKGFHDGTGTVSAVAGGGNYKLQSKTVTPTKSQQSITPDEGFYGLSDVKFGAIPENYQDVSDVTAEAADVLTPKVFVKSDGTVVAGTMANNGAVTAQIDGLTTTEYGIPAGYHNGLGKVSLTNDIEQALAAI